MNIRTLSLNPKNINGLLHWLDANDISTINNGSNTMIGSPVNSIIDKSSGISFNGGSVFTSFEIRSDANNKYGIHFFGNMEQSLSGLSTSTYSVSGDKTIFFVSIPNPSGLPISSESYHLSIIRPDNTIYTYPGGAPAINFRPNVSIYSDLFSSYTYFLETDVPHTSDVFDNKYNTPNNVLNIYSIRVSNRICKFCKFISSPSSGYTTYNSYYTYTTPVPIQNGSKIIIGDIVNYEYNGASYPSPYSSANPVSPNEFVFFELLYYDRVLNDAEMSKVGEYLRNKWIPIY